MPEMPRGADGAPRLPRGWNHRLQDGSAYIGNRPDKASVQSICRKISERTTRRHVPEDPERMVAALNRMMSGWANHFRLGRVSPAYAAIDAHATRRLRQWLCRKHKVNVGKHTRFPNERLWDDYGLIRLAPTTKGLPWAKGVIPSESRMPENGASGLTSGGLETRQWEPD